MTTVQHNIKNNKKDVEYITYSTPWKKIINAKIYVSIPKCERFSCPDT